MNKHSYSDVIAEAKTTEKQPTNDESSKGQTGQPLDDNSPPGPPKQWKN